MNLFYLGFFLLGISLFFFRWACLLNKKLESRFVLILISSCILTFSVVSFVIMFFEDFSLKFRIDLVIATCVPYVALYILYFLKLKSKVEKDINALAAVVNTGLIRDDIISLKSKLKSLDNLHTEEYTEIKKLRKRIEDLEQHKPNRYQRISED